MSGSFVWLAVLSVFVRLLIYLTCIAAMPRVHARSPDNDARITLRGGPAVPILGLLVSVGLLSRVQSESVIATVILLGVGSVLFAIAGVQRRRNRAQR